MTALRISGHTVPVLRFSDFAGGWECLPLGEVGELKNGLNKDKTDFGFGFPFVNLMDVFGRSILDRTELGLVNATPAELKSYDLREGDVLFIRSSVKRDGVAAAILIPNTLPQTVFSGFLIRFRESQVNLSLEFKRYVFGTPGFRKEVLSYATTSANTNINQESLEQVAIVFPTLPEQRKIADFLTAVDGRIGQLSQKKALLEDYKKGVMQQLFTQALRFKDDHGNDFPEWEENEFGEIAELAKDKHNPMKSKQCFQCIELESLSQNTGKVLETFPSSGQKSIKSAFKKGDVLFGKLRPYLRKFHHAETDGVCSTEIWVMRGKTVTNGFLFHLIQSHKFNQAANVSSGSKMPRSDWEYLSSVPFSHPSSKNEQTKIANFLTALDRKIESVAQQITHTQTFKKGLLQQMFV